MEKVIGAIYEMSGLGSNVGKSKVNEIFNRYDTNRDHSLDKYEFINFITTDSVCQQAFRL